MILVPLFDLKLLTEGPHLLKERKSAALVIFGSQSRAFLGHPLQGWNRSLNAPQGSIFPPK